MRHDSDYQVSLDLRSDLLEAKLFSSSSAPWQQRILRQFISRMKLPKHAKCLDAACGVGNNLRTLAAFDFDISGFDKSPSALAFARMRYAQTENVPKLEVGDLQSISFADNTFDVVLCTEALEHVRDIDAVVAELSRVLKPDGYMILSFQNYLNLSAAIKPLMEAVTGKNWDAWGSHGHDEGFERHLNYFMMRSALRRSKLDIVSVRGADYLNGWLNWVPFVRRNYDLLDQYPFEVLGRIPVIKLLGMDCFIVARKR